MLLPSIGLRSLAPPLGTWFATSRAEKFSEHFPFCCSASTRSLHSFVSPMLFSLSFCSDLRSTYTLVRVLLLLAMVKKSIPFPFIFPFSLSYLFNTSTLLVLESDERVSRKKETLYSVKDEECWIHIIFTAKHPRVGWRVDVSSLLGASVENPFSIHHHSSSKSRAFPRV